MGNIDFTTNKQFMASHNKLSSNFEKQKPLFNVEDISFPLYTRGMQIVDSKGKRVKIAGGNWSGGHLCRHCVDGLQCRPIVDIARDIRYKFKLNAIRLTYSLQLYYDNNIVEDKYLTANPQLKGKTSMEIFDYVIKILTQVGLMVILNNHNSTSMWCCSNQDGDGLWWSYKYPQDMFFQSSQIFANRYKNNQRVIGMDIRNQIRKAHGVDPTWGQKDPLTDWDRAAQICANKVLKVNNNLLILIGGLNYQLDLTGVYKKTVKLIVENKLVYTGHLYSFSWPPSWANLSYDSFKKKMFNSQTFVRGLGYPYVLGEFGNNKRDNIWNYLIQYLKQTDIDWIYWPIDGFKCDPNVPEKDETYGLFTNDFKQIRNPQILKDIISVGPPQGTIIKQQKKLIQL